MDKSSRRRTTKLVASYLLAIVLANNVIAIFGADYLWITAFFLIPFDLVVRDILHEKWRGNQLWTKICGLILTGGAISYLTNTDTLVIALAGLGAIMSAGIINTIFYEIFYKFNRFARMNLSNIFASIADSWVFLAIAFPNEPFWLALLLKQATTKSLGGLFWSSLYLSWKTATMK